MLNAITFVFGLFAGTFLNSCIDGLAHGTSINPLRWLCPSCRNPVPLHQKMPLLGYALSKGRCPECHAPLSIRYPLMEVAVALVLFLLFGRYGFSLEFFAKTFFVLLLILISFLDFTSGKIPHLLAVGGLSLGLLLAFFRKPFFSYEDALYGIVFCGGILFVIAFCYGKFFGKEVMGFGDIELLCTIGAFCGLKGSLFSLLAGSLLGTLIGIPIMLLKGRNTRYAIPFGPLLSLSALFFMHFGDRIVSVFLRFVSGI